MPVTFNHYSHSQAYTRMVQSVLKKAYRAVRCPKGAAVSVIFISDKRMRALNKKYRGKAKTTNVLAFEAGITRDLGDIFISLHEAKREARKYGWTIQYAIVRLALHGFLHLLGYDHVRNKEAKVMEGLEQKILKKYAKS